LNEWTKPPSGSGVGGDTLQDLKEKIRLKEEGWRREEELKRSLAREQEPQQALQAEPLKPVEQPLSENRPSMSISWGQGVSKRTPEPQGPANPKAAPMVGKMPWMKAANGGGGGGGGSGGRRSKFGPPVGASSIIPPPSLAEMPQLATGGAAPLAPPEQAEQQAQQAQVSNMAGHAQAGLQQHAGGGYEQQQYNYEQQYNMQQQYQQPEPQPTPEPQQPAKPPRNPKPQMMDMEAMLAAAQQHMQKSLTSKLMSIGVPVQRWEKMAHGSVPGMPGGEGDPESIPLPGDPGMVDMDIADIPAPPQDIPMPGEGLDDIAAPDDDIAAPEAADSLAAPPGDDDCPPGEEDLAPPGCD